MTKEKIRVNQKNPADCALCSIAMFTGYDYNTIVKQLPFMIERIQDLKHGGMMTEEIAQTIFFLTRKPPLIMRNFWLPQTNKARIMRMIDGRPAIICTMSINFENTGHAVYWDGREVIDPSNKKRHTRRSIMPYEVIL